MLLIEPCCTPKHLLALRAKLGEGGTAPWHGYGDLSIAELLPPLLTRYSEVELLIVSPRLPDHAAALIRRVMSRQFHTADGKDKVYTIARLTLVTDLSLRRSPEASTWVKDNPFPGRLVLRDVQQNDTAVVLPDIALWGPINMVYGGHFTAMATKNEGLIAQMRKCWTSL